MFRDGCFQTPCDMRLVLIRQTHIYLKHPLAHRAYKMMMMFMAGLSADKKHGLPIISVHAVQ